MVLEAWRNGVSLTIGQLAGSAFEPLVVTDSVWTFRGKMGAVTRVEIGRAEMRFSWKELFRGDRDRWFQRLKLTKVSGKIVLPLETPADPRAPRRNWLAIEPPRGRWLPLPARVEASEVDFVVQRNGNSVRFEGTRFLASELEPGFVSIARLTVKQPWLDRTFREVRGTTKLQDSKLLIADLMLEPGVVIRSFSAELAELAKGRVDLEMQVAAFGGKFHGEAQTLTHEHPVTIDASVTFEQIGIAKLATFLGVSEAAGGTIKTGTFRFRGAPRAFEKASASLWLEADHFQWESRQWDSLTVGASLLERRVRVSEMHLHQGHNRLDLSGEMALPMPGVKWWQNEFTCDVAAKIEEMAELSALLLPEFKFAAGRAKIDGSIRGRNQQFSGQLIVSGTDLKWRDAPIQNLHAAVKLNGNECEISNVELFNRGDYVRGHGVVNILGATQYWGELRASIDDLATYASILQKPIVPEPLAGGAVIEWTGEGSAKGQSGKFLAHLNKLRSLGALATQLHPINADLEATYTQAGMHFSQLTLSDDESSFSAKVDVGNKALALREIRLVTGSQITLEGDATLPLDVWRAWPNTLLASLLNDETPSAVNLTATNLDLRRASQLAGWNFPIAGTLNGAVIADGPLAALALDGKLTLTGGRLPLGWSGEEFTAVESTVALHGAEIGVEEFAAQHRFGDLRLSGSVGLKNVRDPQLALRLDSARASLPVFRAAPETVGRALRLPGATEAVAPQLETNALAPNPVPTGFREDAAIDAPSVNVSLALEIFGPWSAATVRGNARVTSFPGLFLIDWSALWRDDATSHIPPIFSWGEPARSWNLDILCRTETPAEGADSEGQTSLDLRLFGTGGSPELAGTMRWSDSQRFSFEGAPTRIDGTLTFHENRPQNPTLDLLASGCALGEPFTAVLTGPLSHPVRWFFFQPPLTQTAIEDALASGGNFDRAGVNRWEIAARRAAVLDTGKLFGASAHISLRAPAALTRGIDLYDWAPIQIPDSSETPADAAPAPISDVR